MTDWGKAKKKKKLKRDSEKNETQQKIVLFTISQWCLVESLAQAVHTPTGREDILKLNMNLKNELLVTWPFHSLVTYDILLNECLIDWWFYKEMIGCMNDCLLHL